MFVVSHLLALMLLLAGAHAECEEARTPNMSLTGPIEKYCDYCDVEYGEDIEVYCFADARNLRIRRNEEDLTTKVVNETTVLSILKPTIGEYTYTCIDSNSGCRRSLMIRHQPAVYVSSPRVQFKANEYFVPYGDDFQVICVGGEHQTLDIYVSLDKVNTDVINDTSVGYSARADHTGTFDIDCRVNNDVSRDIWLTLDHFPEAHNFSCVSYNRKEVICTWSPSSAETTFKLFYSSELEEKLLCFGMSSVTNCTWRRMVLLDFHLIMQTCNNFICDNQTFTYNFNLIKRMTPVRHIHWRLTNARDVFISWEHEWYQGIHCDHKLEYRLSAFGEMWRQENMSSLQCYDEYCEFRFSLPYPDSDYEVRIYNKLKAATHAWLWSDPAFVNIDTEPLKKCVCEVSNGTAESITTSDAACEACRLSYRIVEVITAISDRKINMKQKREKINRYIKVYKELDDISSIEY